MMAEGAETEAAWENPLIPNAKLRQLYRGMVRLRELARALPAARRDGAGMEACLVSTSVDLGPTDVVSDTLTGGVVEFLRGATVGEALRPGAGKKRGAVADCGAALRLPAGMGVAERMWAALGAAGALKAAAERARAEAKAKKESAKDGSVVMAYARPGEVPAAVWKKALTFAVKKELPVIFVVLPARGGAKRGVGVTPLALKCHVPAMPVDADDAVALYRVAQESIGHARIGGGPALMECVPFVVSGAKGKTAGDGIAGLENYLLQRKVATQVWMRQEVKDFAKKVAREKDASN